ncbi:putative mitochondrial large ribosomal subunit [Echria macrotheca]|uniref:Large ribosomal subunit protein mL49 n=1 Tax=Echria macrotheca TaxID=438768 RepID=A0AAJ0BNW5_9PEZI|nr:putative mitochondrial large ribosomal subunit [Echria macrotheca]
MLPALRGIAPRRLIQPIACLRTVTTQAAEASANEEPQARPRPPYLVSRTPSNNLPVYHLAKRGGNYKLTSIKKIDGDKRALQQDLAKALGLSTEQVKIKVPTGHIEVKGHHKSQVESWLQEQGF